MKHIPVLFVFLTASVIIRADVNILIIGSNTPGNTHYSSANIPAFRFDDVAGELKQILEGAGVGAVNVAAEERYRTAVTAINRETYAINLATWFYWPYPGGVETAERWPNLRGESGTAWDYVILIGDPYTMEIIPGFYTLGAAAIAEEVAKGSAEALLLMPWPAAGYSSSLDHYKEVVYRTGRTAGIPVAPAGLAWQAAGSPTGATHPSADGAYIAAATIYSRLFGRSASASSYTYNDAYADTAHATVTANAGRPQYSGTFDFTNPFGMLGDKRRLIRCGQKGTSTEQNIRRRLEFTLDSLNLSYAIEPYTRNYDSSTPADDGLGWPADEEMPISFNHGRHPDFVSDGHKSYETNTNFWQLGFGFGYQYRTHEYPVDASTDHFVSSIAWYDLDIADRMRSGASVDERTSARTIPLRAMWAVISRAYPGERYQRDRTHLNYGLLKAASTYMYTLYSGRTPVDEESRDDKFTDPDYDLFCQRVGYELAWKLGRLQSRVPGFKVKPASRDSAAAVETMSVGFLYPPQEDVTVTISVSDPALASVSHATLVFTPENYADAVDITVTALQRAAGSNPRYEVRFATSSDDAVFDGLRDSWTFVPPADLPPSTSITYPAEGAIRSTGTDLAVTGGSISR